jgi:hypothetical protein
MEGGALAPRAIGNLQDTIQTGIDSDGYSVTFDECKYAYIVMCQFHKSIRARSMLVGTGTVWSAPTTTVWSRLSKTHPDILTYTPLPAPKSWA